MADITLGQFYNAIAQGAREATLDALKGTDFATQTTLAAVLAKLSDDPATESTLDDILSKLSSDPSTATLQTAIKNAVDAVANKVATETTLSAAKGALDTIAGKDFATQTTLAAILDKLADPATQTTLAAVLDKLDNLEVQLKGSLPLFAPTEVIDDEQIIIVEDNVRSLSPPQGAIAANITVEEGAVRYRIRGAANLPTGTVGHRANGDSDIVILSAEDIASFRVTNDAGESYSIIHVSYSGVVS